MSYILKGLYYEWKIKAYEKAIISLQIAREKLKLKQTKATGSREKYQQLLNEHKSLKS